MPKILLNYKRLKDGSYKIYYDQQYVFADMPVCMADMDIEYEEPIVVNIKGQYLVVEKSEYEKVHKLFRFKIVDGDKVVEDKDGFEMYLPKDTDISKLRYINNQIVLIQEEEKKEEENNGINKKQS